MRDQWKVRRRNGLSLAILLLLLSGACNPVKPDAESSLPSPTFTPQPAATQPVNSSADAIAACDPDLQAKAMRPEHVPDWNRMGLDTCYDLVFDLTSGDENYSGSAVITFTNPGPSALNDIVLRTFPNAPVLFGGSLEITSVWVDETELTPEVFLADRSAVRIPLDSVLAAGETIRLQLEYSGILPVDFEREGIYGTYHYYSDGPVITLANAYPLLALLENGEWQASPVLAGGDAVVSRTALYRVEMRVPTGWQAAASGRETSREESGGRTAIIYAGGPLRDFMLAASPAFVLREAQWNGIQINHWGMPNTEGNWDEAIEVTRDSLELFEETFGPLPYNEMDVIAAPLKNASGVEYPGLFLLNENLYNYDVQPHLLPMVTAHEVAHQWWYAVVGNDVLENPWQDEALATYSAQVYEYEYDQAFYFGVLENYKQRVETLEAASGEQAVSQSVSDFAANPRDYATVVYHKGYLFLEALRRQIGDRAFDAALQKYYQENAYHLAPPDALLNSFEFTCQCELDDIYEEWGVYP